MCYILKNNFVGEMGCFRRAGHTHIYMDVKFAKAITAKKIITTLVRKTLAIWYMKYGMQHEFFFLSTTNIMSLFKFEFVVYYSSGGYVGLVHKLAEDNMDRAVSEVKALSEYNAMGEVSSTVFSED